MRKRLATWADLRPLDGPPRPFTKWAGGKQQLLPELLARVPLGMRRYHEPFLGGGALFFALRARRTAFPAVLSDANRALVRAYLALRADPEPVLRKLGRLQRAEPTGRYFDLQHRRHPDQLRTDAEAAVWLIYLNKAGFNGLWRVNRDGYFNVPWGKNPKAQLCDAANLRAVSEALQGTVLSCAPYSDVLHTVDAGSFVYFDPPYAPVHATSSFTGFTPGGFTDDDQAELRHVALRARAKGAHVLISNSDAPLVRELYAGAPFRISEVAATRRINSKGGRRGAVTELLIECSP